MLTTRLSKEGQIEVISRAEVDEAMQPVAESETVNEATARRLGSGDRAISIQIRFEELGNQLIAPIVGEFGHRDLTILVGIFVRKEPGQSFG